MTSREGKDTAIMLEGRKERSKQVKIMFQSPENFDVLDENNNVKYFGILCPKEINDECSCPDWNFSMRFEKLGDEGEKGESRYVAENGHNYNCKHIIRARNLKKLGMKEE